MKRTAGRINAVLDRRSAIALLCLAAAAIVLWRALLYPRWGLIDDGTDLRVVSWILAADSPGEFFARLIASDSPRRYPSYYLFVVLSHALSGGLPLARVILNLVVLWRTLALLRRLGWAASGGRELAGWLAVIAFLCAPSTAQCYMTLSKSDPVSIWLWLEVFAAWWRAGQRRGAVPVLGLFLLAALAGGARELCVCASGALALVGTHALFTRRAELRRQLWLALCAGGLALVVTVGLRLSAESLTARGAPYLGRYELSFGIVRETVPFYASRMLPMWLWVLPLALWCARSVLRRGRWQPLQLALSAWALLALAIILPWPIPDTRFTILAAAPLAVLLGAALVGAPGEQRMPWVRTVLATCALWGCAHGALRTWGEAAARSDLDRAASAALAGICSQAQPRAIVLLFTPFTEREFRFESFARRHLGRADLRFAHGLPEIQPRELVEEFLHAGGWAVIPRGRGTAEFSSMLDSRVLQVGVGHLEPADHAALSAGLREALGARARPASFSAEPLEYRREILVPHESAWRRALLPPRRVAVEQAYEVYRVAPASER